MADLRFTVDPLLDRGLRDALIALWVDVTNAGGAVGFVPPVSAADVRPVAEEAFDRVAAGHDHLVVACDGDRAVGLAFLEQRGGPLFRHWATVKRLQIHPSWQGQGAGTALLEVVHRAGRELGLEQLRLDVRGGTGTEVFYQRHGYEIVARIRRTIRVAPGDDRDQIWLLSDL
ncbi:MAG: GNAT family N-acetyltransferase [Actinobacteria bacterium]|nr:GNAT family N-acetyltransferase [Actinomycetota bacterium]